MMEFTFDGIVRQGFGFYNPNHAAALICAFFPFLWGWKKYAWIGWILTFLLTIPLVMTYSRTGVLVLGFELATYFIISKTKNWKLIAAIAGGILLILFIGGIFGRFALDKAVSNRPEIWLAGLKLYAANPLGVGLGNSGMIVSNFMLENIQCRTLVNSHLTLLTEFGIFTGFFWFSFIFYALISGVKKPRTWCAVAGLCISATSASIFDWDLLSDFQNYGELPLLNFVLSWLLLVIFLALTLYLLWDKINLKRLGFAACCAIFCAILPFCLWKSDIPKVKGDIVYTSSDAPLVLYDEEWNLKSLLPYCKDGYQIPLQPGLVKINAEKIILFGNAAEYAPEFPESKITYINPPEFFEPAANTEKIILPPHDTRNFTFKTVRQ
ncbi:MAG: O-antigen ligase family protein [Lentisphaeria bacterium]|nr:O-antigen ligase family protein [Lentisphaeria bacterium]